MSFPGDRLPSAPSFGPYKETDVSTDWYTKLVLTVIAASAAFLAFQQLEERGSFRYQVQAIPAGRVLLRVDGETGRTWTAPLNRPKSWELIEESILETLDDQSAADGEPSQEPTHPALQQRPAPTQEEAAPGAS